MFLTGRQMLRTSVSQNVDTSIISVVSKRVKAIKRGGCRLD